ncbi:M48 family metallopeptidase [Clostridium beijerinckii]|uniref:M48 family metallopeptidase n=2 Tax=Clostridium beijerinckii TaxID=1520 RepID=A0AB74VKQ1_CLOBE|nr:SprT family zinc-dependent metalloprotease [Clostridium beijerinckii]MBC2457267.1 M48 family metallopeptidase [Clostridium beijerinckii]MBC2474323.1 M48 family metallopeptidase [Clostridium beijerinckii]NOV59221.1 hypothetical protein [Clostridium beijerinckii]NOV72376.1 hypothetical protein [Clostridium beijerinckii]NOW32577.1 hypothetical protein [Clostridium beijerinckii]
MKYKLEFEKKIIEFELIRRKRKTICIKIEESGKVVVSAPLKTSKDYIMLVVRKRSDWIFEKQKEMIQRNSKKTKRDFTPESTFIYLGKEYSFKLIFDEKIKNIYIQLSGNFNNVYRNGKELLGDIDISNEEKCFIIHTNTMEIEKLRAAFEKWYRKETLEIVTQRIGYYSKNFRDKVTGIRVKEQKRRWASCTWKNVILFNWRCSMARPDVLDYIVVHEMCHMDHRNHSKDFWNRVHEIMPDYKEKHEWLKLNGLNMYL